jgi:hypothetical protein
MKLKITTEYTNVTQEWLEWWYSNPKPPEVENAMAVLKTIRIAVHVSKDPTSNVIGKTIYEVTE